MRYLFVIAIAALFFFGCKKDSPTGNPNPASIYSVLVKSLPTGAVVYVNNDSTPKITPSVFSNLGGNVTFRFSREACKDTIVQVFIKNNDSLIVKLIDSVTPSITYDLPFPQKITLNAQFNTNVLVSFYSIKTPSASYSFIADTLIPFTKDVPSVLKAFMLFTTGDWDISIKGKFTDDTSFTFYSRTSVTVK